MKPTIDLTLARVCVRASTQAYAQVSFESELAHVLVIPATATMPMIIAFRGTCDIGEWLVDFRMRFSATLYGRLHTGFWRSVNSVMAEVFALPDVKSALPVIVTGHSKGAAEALICARWLAAQGKPVQAVVTFGGPRVGDAQWRAGYNASLGEVTKRWVHEEDIVARAPVWMMGYRHVGHEYFMSSMGGVEVDPPLWRLAASDLWGTFWGYKAGRIEQAMDHPISRYQEHLEQL